jgi:hypothetical protein
VAETKKIELRVGRGTLVGNVTLTSWTPDRIFLTVSSHNGFSPAVVLTPEQVQELRRALDEISPRTEERLLLVA